MFPDMATQGSHSQQQLMRSSERRMFLASDDGALMKQIQSTHSPDGRFINVKPILRIIDNVLRHLTPNIDHHALNGGQGHMDAIDDMSSSAAMDGNCMLDALAYVIHKISCEANVVCDELIQACRLQQQMQPYFFIARHTPMSSL